MNNICTDISVYIQQLTFRRLSGRTSISFHTEFPAGRPLVVALTAAINIDVVSIDKPRVIQRLEIQEVQGALDYFHPGVPPCVEQECCVAIE